MSSIQSIDKMVLIIEALSSEPKGLGITELYENLHIPKSTIHRILSSLTEHNMVRQDKETNKYFLGLYFLHLATSILDNLDIRNTVRPYLEYINQRTNEVVHLCTLDNGEIVYIDKVDSKRKIKISSSIGVRGPVHCTGVGKAILAGMAEDEVRRILKTKGMRAYTENTITDKDYFIEELKTIRNEGYAVDNIENEPGIRCIAAPIFNHEGKTVAAISISGPSDRMTVERIEEELKKMVIDVSVSISKEMGYVQLNN